MRLFVTVGLEGYPFDRLVSAVDAGVAGGVLDGDTFMQYGSTAMVPRSARGAAYVGFDRMLELIGECDVVVAHAGVGTVLACRDLGKTPVLVPREHDRGEHVDDHQLEFATALEEMGLVRVARGAGEELAADIVAGVREVARLGQEPTGPLVDDGLAAYLTGVIAALPDGRR